MRKTHTIQVSHLTDPTDCILEVNIITYPEKEILTGVYIGGAKLSIAQGEWLAQQILLAIEDIRK